VRQYLAAGGEEAHEAKAGRAQREARALCWRERLPEAEEHERHEQPEQRRRRRIRQPQRRVDQLAAEKHPERVRGAVARLHQAEAAGELLVRLEAVGVGERRAQTDEVRRRQRRAQHAQAHDERHARPCRRRRTQHQRRRRRDEDERPPADRVGEPAELRRDEHVEQRTQRRQLAEHPGRAHTVVLVGLQQRRGHRLRDERVGEHWYEDHEHEEPPSHRLRH
tara:strand:+ start:1097 stop:1762 length:666 start_codon:yes stop_codon:yes gene_type:complete